MREKRQESKGKMRQHTRKEAPVIYTLEAPTEDIKNDKRVIRVH